MFEGPGSGRLRFESVAGRTVVTERLARSPLFILQPRRPGPAAWAYLGGHGGGMVQGDRMDLTLSVGPGATALVTTQASPKIYGGRDCRQSLAARVEGDGLLALLPDPLVCYADSAFCQDQDLALGSDANLVWLDWFSSGRRAHGETWKARRYENRLRLTRAGRTLVDERLLLDPADGALAGRMGPYHVLATVLVSGPALAREAQGLDAACAAMPAAACSPLADGGRLLRLAAEDTAMAAARLRALLAFVNPRLGGDPWAAKEYSPQPVPSPSLNVEAPCA